MKNNIQIDYFAEIAEININGLKQFFNYTGDSENTVQVQEHKRFRLNFEYDVIRWIENYTIA